MGHVIGHGRYARATYPQSPGAGGSAASGNPLSRQRFIDGDTTSPGPGAASAPFKTIAAFIASRGNASVADATANYVGWLMPALNGYAEDIAFPPHVSTELRADSFSLVPGSGTYVTGNVTWANVGGAHDAIDAAVIMHNVSLVGSLTVTDDGNAPPSILFFGGDEIGEAGVTLAEFDSSGASNLISAAFTNAIVNDINAGTAASSADIAAFSSELNGSISAGSMVAVDSLFNVTSITLSAGGTSDFTGCKFALGSVPVLDCQGFATFDGPSWLSFLTAGGTRSAAGTGTVVLVVGGYNGGTVEGAALPTTGVNTDVSISGNAATAGYTGSNSGNHYSSSDGLTADGASVTLKTTGNEHEGDTMLITKPGSEAHPLAVFNGGTNAGTIGIIPSGSRGFVLAQYSSATNDWILASCGSLVA